VLWATALNDSPMHPPPPCFKEKFKKKSKCTLNNRHQKKKSITKLTPKIEFKKKVSTQIKYKELTE